MSPTTPRTRWFVIAFALVVMSLDLWTKQLVVAELASPSHPLAVQGGAVPAAATATALLATRGLDAAATATAIEARVVWRYRRASPLAAGRVVDEDIAHLQLLALADTGLPAPRRMRVDPSDGAADLGTRVAAAFGVDGPTAAWLLDGGLWQAEAPVRSAAETFTSDEAVVVLTRDVDLIPGFMKLVYAENPGAAWSFLAAANASSRIVFFSAIAMFAALAMLWAIWTGWLGSPLATWALGAILGGALGNLVDRLRYRVVIDFVLNYIGELRWPVYNVADIGITVGVALIVLELLRSRSGPPVDAA